MVLPPAAEEARARLGAAEERSREEEGEAAVLD